MTAFLTFLWGNVNGILIGLVIGWWFLPQPRFIRWIGEKIGVVKPAA